jgi:FMN phosphatase YigB (HAD superfamily)
VGARRAGVPVAWLNRSGYPLPEGMPEPDLQVSSLHDLLVALPGR